MKKIITLLTCMALVFAMIPCQAFAEEAATTSTAAASTNTSGVSDEIIAFVKSLSDDQIAAVKNANNIASLIALKSSLSTEQSELLNKVTLDATILHKLKDAIELNADAITTDSTEDIKGAIQLVGGWTPAEDGTITEEIKAVFAEKSQELLGAGYEPIKIVATQVVAGTNYKILCKATLVTNPPVTKYVYVTLYRDLEDNWSILEGGIEDVFTVTLNLKVKAALKKINGKKAVKISWEDKDGEELEFDKYLVYRATSKNGKYTKLGSTTKSSYTDKTAKTGKTYYYKIKGYKNIDGEKVYSKYTSAISKKVK